MLRHGSGFGRAGEEVRSPGEFGIEPDAEAAEGGLPAGGVAGNLVERQVIVDPDKG